MTNELQNITAQPSSAKQVAKTTVAPRVLIDQNDLFVNIFSNLSDSTYIGTVLMLYITSLARHNIAAQHDISKLVIVDLVRRKQFDTLQNLIKFSLINESKVLACFLLSLSHEHLSVTQMALDMLYKLNAETVRKIGFSVVSFESSFICTIYNRLFLVAFRSSMKFYWVRAKSSKHCAWPISWPEPTPFPHENI